MIPPLNACHDPQYICPGNWRIIPLGSVRACNQAGKVIQLLHINHAMRHDALVAPKDGDFAHGNLLDASRFDGDPIVWPNTWKHTITGSAECHDAARIEDQTRDVT